MNNPVVSGPIHGFYIHKYQRLNSTNDQALDWVTQQGGTQELVIWTEDQSHGRGQGQNTWYSVPGQSLLFSVLLYPHQLNAAHAFMLNQLMAVAAQSMLTKYLPGERVQLKWPNDIWVQNKKLGGILIQTGISGAAIKYAVAGLGINVNQAEFPAHLPQSTSMQMLCGKPHDLTTLLYEFLATLQPYYMWIQEGNYQDLTDLYKEHLLGWQQLNIYMTKDGRKPFAARFVALDDHGQMVLETEQGLNTYQHQQIKYLGPSA